MQIPQRSYIGIGPTAQAADLLTYIGFFLDYCLLLTKYLVPERSSEACAGDNALS
jgi:hypothetical protein